MALYRPTAGRNFQDFGFKCKEGQVIDLTDARAKEINGVSPGLLEPFDKEKHMPDVYDSIARRMYNPFTHEHFGPEIDDPKAKKTEVKPEVKVDETVVE